LIYCNNRGLTAPKGQVKKDYAQVIRGAIVASIWLEIAKYASHIKKYGRAKGFSLDLKGKTKIHSPPLDARG